MRTAQQTVSMVVGNGSTTPTIRERVLQAFVEQVAEHGLANTSIDAIAAAANVSKVTLYKRWPTRYDLVMDAFDLLGRVLEVDVELSARQNFDRLFSRVSDPCQRRWLRQLLSELITASGYDEVAAAKLRTRQDDWIRFTTDLVEHGKRTGEFPADRDSAVAAQVAMAVATTGHLMSNAIIVDNLDEIAWDMLSRQRPF